MGVDATKCCVLNTRAITVSRRVDARVRSNVIVNMSVAFVLAVVFLPVILFSLPSDARPTADENTPCNSSTLEDVTKEIKDEIRDQTEDVKKLLASKPIAYDAVGPSKQALASAFLCEHISFYRLIMLTCSVVNDVFVINPN